MKKNHSRRAAFVALLAASALGLVTASPAAAAGSCLTGWVCFYKAHDFSTADSHLDRYGNEVNWPAWITNQEHSVSNHGTSGQMVRVFTLDYHLNPVYCVKMGSDVNLPDNKDAQGNSHHWTSGLTGCY